MEMMICDFTSRILFRPRIYCCGLLIWFYYCYYLYLHRHTNSRFYMYVHCAHFAGTTFGKTFSYFSKFSSHFSKSIFPKFSNFSSFSSFSKFFSYFPQFLGKYFRKNLGKLEKCFSKNSPWFISINKDDIFVDLLTKWLGNIL